MEGGRRRGKGDEKRIERSYVHAPTPHKEYKHCILQTCTKKSIHKNIYIFNSTKENTAITKSNKHRYKTFRVN